LAVAFQYHSDILARFPSLVGGVIVARGMRNSPTPEPLRDAYVAEQQAVIGRIGDQPLSELPSLAAWRGAFRAFGVDPTQYRSAAEALLRRLTKKGDIPSINTLVDIGNLVSIRYGIPIAVCDTRALAGAVTVHFADGTERYVLLGQSEPEHPEVGEVVFSDPTGGVIARRWCWRQSDDSAAREDTTDAIITVEAHHSGGRADVQGAMDDVLELLSEYVGGSYHTAILGRDLPQISYP
jgi:DNA/RNA-binding domain of Phe-tRNA-synthetase-like protein